MLRTLVLLLSALAIPAFATDATPAPRIVGYVTDGAALPTITPGKLDIINFAFAHVDAQHRVVLDRATSQARLRELVALKQRNPRLKIVLSVGGWGAGGFSEAAATPATRKVFVDSALALLRDNALDGLDIDWEYPTLPGPGIAHSPDDKRNFTVLLRELRARFGHRYWLSIAAAEGEFAQGLDVPAIARVLDAINLMAYDFHGSLTPTTGHHAGLQRSVSAPQADRTAEQAVDFFLRAGVPADKLVLGVAFYGREFDDVDAANDGLYQPYRSGGGFVSWKQIHRELLADAGYARHWDEQAQAPWLWNAQRHRFISYDDPQSLQAKAQFIRAKRLGGAMYWSHADDDDEQLLDALDAGLHRGR